MQNEVNPHNTKSTIVTALVELLKSCLMDTAASPEKAEYYRHCQFLTVLTMIPLTSIAIYFIIPLSLISALQFLENWKLISWTISLVIVSLITTGLWWRYIVKKKQALSSRFERNLLFLMISFAALLYTYLILQLFGRLENDNKIVLIAIGAAFASTGGWLYASMPLVSISWSLILAGGTGVGLLVLYKDHHLLAYLAIFYSVFLCVTILVTSRHFIKNLVSQTKIEKQSELISLLLHEFEENVSDWLWEIDNRGVLQHISVQLVDASEKTVEDLRQQTLLNVIHGLLENKDKNSEGLKQFEYLKNTLEKNIAFKHVLLPVKIKQEIRWWSFKAKPLFNSQRILTGWRGVTSDITEAYTQELEMTKLANQDSLTGLANRYNFINAINNIVPESTKLEPCLLMLLDIDNFKNVNDSLGHSAGDQLLRHFATQINSVIPESSLLARLGGDEFALIVKQNANQIINRASAVKIAEDIQTKIDAPFTLQGHKVEVNVSIGVSFAPEDAMSTDGLLKAADIALYHAKEERNKVSFFTTALKEKALYKQILLNDLKKAIDENQFFLVYQPQYDLNSLKLVGFEALLRWQHPTLGVIPPSDIIPLAESSQLIIQLGEWALQQACRDAMAWPSSVNLAVNVSAIQLESSEFEETVNQALSSSGLLHNRLEFEITESSVMRSSPRILTMLSEFRKLGGRIAIDDFGTGFSSFSYLHSFPLDKLKIDGSFIALLETASSNNQAQAIVNSIIQLGKALNLQVTAEGIETLYQQNLLKDLVCHLGQGYLFAKPMKAEKIQGFIEKNM